jgi:hypothetical protein
MIYNSDGNQMLSSNLAMFSTEVKTDTITIDCKTGYFLSSSTVDNILVEAKKVGGGSWTNIETTPIDLSADNGTQQDYEIRLTAGTITTMITEAVIIRVAR